MSESDQSVQAEEAPSVSEMEACQTVPELITLALGLRGGEGPVAISEISNKMTHLIGVQAVLESEEAPLLGSLREFSEIFQSTYPSLGVSEPPRVFLSKSLEQLTTATEALNSSCTEIGQGFEAINLPLGLKDFFPDGFWTESVTEIHLIYAISSDDDLSEVTLENGVPVYTPNEKIGTMLQMTCDTKNASLGVTVSRHDGLYNSKPLGPQGAIKVYISLDGGPEMQQDGYFVSGMLFPYMNRVSIGELKAQGTRMWNAISSGKDYFTIRVDEPGSRFDATFPLQGIESVAEGLDSRGCFDF